jgi:uncharacterized protein YhaN
VYDLLCDYHRKKILKKELTELQDWQVSMTIKMHQQQASGVIVDMDRYESNFSTNQARVDTLRREIAEIDSNPGKLVCCNDVLEMMKTLKQKLSKKDVEEMIWECDEDLDGCLNWDEFRLMFSRNLMDKSGLEPSRMVITDFSKKICSRLC